MELFHSNMLTKNSNNHKGNKDQCGDFYKYLICDAPELLKENFVKLQKFDSLFDERGEVR